MHILGIPRLEPPAPTRQIPAVIKRSAFLPIASPRLVKEPPTGPDWLHEVKFDGFRIQIHKAGEDVCLFSRSGKDFTDRFPAIASAVPQIGVKKAVIDGELVVCDGSDRPDFYSLLGRRISGLCVWCFDLLMLNGRDLRSQPLHQRKRKLEAVLRKTGNDATLRLSHTFEDGQKLLAAVARQGLEGVVSKRRLGVYARTAVIEMVGDLTHRSGDPTGAFDFGLDEQQGFAL